MAFNFKGKHLTGSSAIFKTSDKRLATDKLRGAHAKAINALWADAINVFVLTAVQSMAVDTGMSVASFYSIANQVGLGAQKIEGYANMKLRGTGKKAAVERASARTASEGGAPRTRRGYTTITGDWRKGTAKNRALGSKHGQKAYTVTFADKSKGIVSFSFEIVVWQHAHLYASSLEEGKQAMEAYIKNNYAKRLSPTVILKSILNI